MVTPTPRMALLVVEAHAEGMASMAWMADWSGPWSLSALNSATWVRVRVRVMVRVRIGLGLGLGTLAPPSSSPSTSSTPP